MFSSFFWLLTIFAFLALVSSFLSVNPKVSLKDSRELLLFLIVPIVYVSFRKHITGKKANLAFLASGYITCAYSIAYYFLKAKPWERIVGFMTHAMTQGGLLLLFSCMAISILLFAKDKIRYLWGFGLLLSLFALMLTRTRSAWIGFIIASVFILILYKPKTIIFVPIALCIFYIISPQQIKKRAVTLLNPSSKSDKLRIEYLKAGIKIIKEYPIFGTGPDTVDMVYQDPKYNLSEDAKRNVHLHNNILQIAAEKGIPCLLVWLSFIVYTFVSLFKLFKNKDPTHKTFAMAGLAAILALFISGFFEYNFADSEITALFLYMITLPFSLRRLHEKTSQT